MKGYLHWFVAGIMIGLLNIASFMIKKPLGASSSYGTAVGVAGKALNIKAIDKNEFLRQHSSPDYLLILSIFMTIGGYISSRIFGKSKEKPDIQVSPVSKVQQVLGGFTMLFGARIGKGCTSGNILSGGAQMSAGSLLFTVATFAGGVLAAMLVGGRR